MAVRQPGALADRRPRPHQFARRPPCAAILSHPAGGRDTCRSRQRSSSGASPGRPVTTGRSASSTSSPTGTGIEPVLPLPLRDAGTISRRCAIWQSPTRMPDDLAEARPGRGQHQRPTGTGRRPSPPRRRSRGRRPAARRAGLSVNIWLSRATGSAAPPPRRALPSGRA